MPPQPQVTPERIVQFGFGFASTLVIEAAVRHGIFDIIDSGSKTVEELAAETGASTRGLRAVMNALIALNLLSKNDDDVYSLTPESATFLVSSKPAFFGGLFRHASVQLIPKWMNLTEIVQTGVPPAESAGTNVPEFYKAFVEEIFPVSYSAAKTLADALGVPASTAPISVLDIASGSGVWGVALAQASTNVRITAVDLPEVLDVTRKIATRFQVDDRFEYVGGDMLTIDYGKQFNIATLGHILHVSGEVDNRKLIERVFESLVPGGTIAIAEFLVNEDRTGPPQALIFAVNMLVNTSNGDTYSFGEIQRWLNDAGFIDARTLEASGPSPLVLATKPA